MSEIKTILIDEKINKIIRRRQADRIKKTSKSHSFSTQINEDLADYYKVKL